jgi:hypothetical protein
MPLVTGMLWPNLILGMNYFNDLCGRSLANYARV